MLNKNKLEKYMDKADAQLQKGNLIEAKENYLKALSIEPDNVIILNNLSHIYKILNDDAKSIGYAEILLEECNKQLLDDENEILLTLKSNSLMQLGKEKEAEEIFEKLLKINPKNIRALFHKAQILESNHSYPEVLTCLDRILEEDEYNIAALLAKGRNLTKLKEYGEGEKYFNIVFEIEPKNKAAINLKSKLLKEKNNSTISPHDLMLKAIEFWEMEEFKKSLAYFDKALDLDDAYDEIWYARGELLIRMGRINDAINSFKKAFEINPKSGGIVKKKEFFKLLNAMKKINTILGYE